MALPGTVTVPVHVKIKWPLMLRLWLALFRWRDRRWRRKNPVAAQLLDELNRRVDEVLLLGEGQPERAYTLAEREWQRVLHPGRPPVDGEGKDIT